MAVLRFNNNNKEQEIACEAVITIGRGKNNDIMLADKLVSRNHAIVRRLGEHDYYLIDEGSANGSYINATKVLLPTLLQDGDKITIGNTHMAFRQDRKDQDECSQEDADADTVLIQPDVEVREFAILVADIRGFTSLSESMPIKVLTEIMNQWFHAATDCVADTGGIVDKFLGDCVYARWEMGGSVKDTVLSALGAACKLNRQSQIISSKYNELPNPIRIGVGVHTGIAALGVDRSKTAIGDAVNLAFRLEGVSKRLGKDVILSSDAYVALPPGMWQEKSEVINVRGKTEPVEILALNFDELSGVCSDQ